MLQQKLKKKIIQIKKHIFLKTLYNKKKKDQRFTAAQQRLFMKVLVYCYR